MTSRPAMSQFVFAQLLLAFAAITLTTAAAEVCNKNVISPIGKGFKVFTSSEHLKIVTSDWFSDPKPIEAEFGPIEEWCFGKGVQDMSELFRLRRSFNRDIGGWNVKHVLFMRAMFYFAKAFNQDLNSWNVGRVRDMGAMFADAQSFNKPIGNWDVSQVIDMNLMFSGSSSFNHPLDNWDVSRTKGMEYMFARAKSFNQDLCPWGPRMRGRPYPDVELMFERSGCNDRRSPQFLEDPFEHFCAVEEC